MFEKYEVEIKVLREGRYLGEILKLDGKNSKDIITIAFAQLLAGLLHGTNELDKKSYPIRHHFGTSHFFVGNTTYTITNNSYYEGLVYIGTGQGTPSIYDNWFFGEVWGDLIDVYQVLIENNRIIVSLSGDVRISEEHDYYECGLVLRLLNTSGNIIYSLLIHDVFTQPLHLYVGDIVMITYKFIM